MIVEVSEVGKIELKVAENDAEDFVSYVEKIINGAVFPSKPDHIFVVEIENRFDSKWVAFSGKVLGALGTWNNPTTIPPFHPNRVVSQSNFVFDVKNREIKEIVEEPRLHIRQESTQNQNRFIKRFYPKGAFFWISSNSRINGRGSLMSYLPTEHDHWLWYLDFESDPLRIVEYVWINKQEVDQFLLTGTRG